MVIKLDGRNWKMASFTVLCTFAVFKLLFVLLNYRNDTINSVLIILINNIHYYPSLSVCLNSTKILNKIILGVSDDEPKDVVKPLEGELIQKQEISQYIDVVDFSCEIKHVVFTVTRLAPKIYENKQQENIYTTDIVQQITSILFNINYF